MAIAEVLVHCLDTYADWQADPRGHAQVVRACWKLTSSVWG